MGKSQFAVWRIQKGEQVEEKGKKPEAQKINERLEDHLKKVQSNRR